MACCKCCCEYKTPPGVCCGAPGSDSCCEYPRVCCGPGGDVTSGSAVCCDEGATCCNGDCCGTGYKCCGETTCCENSQACCGESCCDTGECCVGGVCEPCDCDPACSSDSCEECVDGECVSTCAEGEYCCDGVCRSWPCSGCTDDSDCTYVIASCSGAGEPGCGFGCSALEAYYYPDTAAGLAAALAYLDAYDNVPECGTCSVDSDTGKCCDGGCFPDPGALPACAGSPATCPS